MLLWLYGVLHHAAKLVIVMYSSVETVLYVIKTSPVKIEKVSQIKNSATDMNEDRCESTKSGNECPGIQSVNVLDNKRLSAECDYPGKVAVSKRCDEGGRNANGWHRFV